MVASADGAAALNGRSGGLGGPADRLLFQVLRSLSDVILVGAGTARAEKYRPARPSPGLAALRQGRPPTPPIAVVSASLDLDPDGTAAGRGAARRADDRADHRGRAGRAAGGGRPARAA